ncbi:MAG: hypothetical protein ACI8W8_000365 [Rhodothermales bacterium]|jgi:hypothetical protein
MHTIPSLPNAPNAIAGTVPYQRDFGVGPVDFRRVWAGDELCLRLISDSETLQARLHTDLCDEPVPFVDTGNGALEACVPCPENGRFHARVAFCDDGETWLWDPEPASYILVLPKRRRSVRVYTLIPTVSGNISDWIAKLPGIRDLGFNTVHLLPVTQMDLSQSPYSARDLFRVDPGYHDPDAPGDVDEQFERFIDALESHELALCVDLVLNHVGTRSLLAQQRPDWLMTDAEEDDGIKRAGWSDGTHWYKWGDLALVDYDCPFADSREALWETMYLYAQLWGERAARTGGMIRLDNLHSSHPTFTAATLDRLRAEFPNLLFLGELFAMPDQLAESVWEFGLNLLLATPWEHPFVPELRRYFRYLHEQHERWQYFVPLTSHDSGAPAQEFGSPASAVPRFAFSALCGSGHTGATQGSEFGINERLDFIGIKPPRPIETGLDFRDEIRRINQLVDSEPAFNGTGNLRFIDEDHHAVTVAWRTAPEGHDDFIVLCNFDIHRPQHIRLRLGEELSIEDALEGGRLRIGPEYELTLPPCGVRVWRLSK